MSVAKTGWGGSHTFRVGGEYMLDDLDAPFFGYGNPCNCVSTLNNGVPAQVQILLGTNVSRNELVTSAGYVDDTWRLNRRLTLSLGVRLDRYQPGLPEHRALPASTSRPSKPVLTFNNWGPRLGLSADLTGDGKTVLKLHYGRFWLYPAPTSPRPSIRILRAGRARIAGPTTPTATGDGTRGGGGAHRRPRAAARPPDSIPSMSNMRVEQATAYVEREVARDFAVRTGFVFNAKRDTYGTINVNRPLSAYSRASHGRRSGAGRACQARRTMVRR